MNKIAKNLLKIIVAASVSASAQAADLMEIYQQALHNDPVFQQAVSERLVTRENVPIALSAILPNINFTGSPMITRTGFSGSLYRGGSENFILNPRNMTNRSYQMALTLNQTIFDFGKFNQVAGAVQLAKGADATLNAALQDLMVRVANTYFAVLRDEDNLSYNEASKVAFAEQLDQVKQQFNVGLKTITDVYVAQASYDSAVATYISAEAALANDKENLRALTGNYYDDLYTLKDDFPLISPEPKNIELWVKKALQQNWNIQSMRYQVRAALLNVKQQTAGHLPTINMQASMDRKYSDTINGYSSLANESGPGTQTDRMIGLNVTMPIFAGGGVVAATHQAQYQYNVAQQALEQITRATTNATRQSYLNVLAGISQVQADKQAIKSNVSSLAGMEESYRVGTETLVNVLNQQQKLFQAQVQYAKDRYAFVSNVLLLKQAAGTLSQDDLISINSWLSKKKVKKISKHFGLTYPAKTNLHKKALHT